MEDLNLEITLKQYINIAENDRNFKIVDHYTKTIGKNRRYHISIKFNSIEDKLMFLIKYS